MNNQSFQDLMLLQQKQELKKLTDCNQYTRKFGLALSESEALMLRQSGREQLKEQERVEFSGGILPKLVYEFCDSPYIYQDIYAETLDELQRIFYLYKNETMDYMSDDELLHYMRICFNNECGGDLDHLEGTCLDTLARMIREENAGRGME